jgi:hypothetical protein
VLTGDIIGVSALSQPCLKGFLQSVRVFYQQDMHGVDRQRVRSTLRARLSKIHSSRHRTHRPREFFVLGHVAVILEIKRRGSVIGHSYRSSASIPEAQRTKKEPDS